MNFSQMHERLRQELLRRISRGTLSVSLLARQTGFGQSHLSNFLHRKRRLSLQALDQILAVLHLSAADLLPATTKIEFAPLDDNSDSIPVVSHAIAMSEPHIRPSSAQLLLHLPASFLLHQQERCSSQRRSWQRFVAIRPSDADAQAMDPLVLPGAFAVLDRHYTSLRPHRPARPSLYAVRHGAHLILRYADFHANRLLLRPHQLSAPIEALEIPPDSTPNDLLTGRVLALLNET